jgi:hypothetical protein
MSNSVSIRQAARQADREGTLYIGGDTQEPTYAVYVSSAPNDPVVHTGTYDQCSAHMLAQGCEFGGCAAGYQPTSDGRTLRMVSLEEICEQLDESEGEERCIPDAWVQREWA